MYIERLIATGLEPLELRRIHFDLILLYKIIFNLLDLDLNEFFNINCTPHSDKVGIQSSRTDVMLYSFFRLTPKLWNTLPESTTNSQSLIAFKADIHKL